MSEARRLLLENECKRVAIRIKKELPDNAGFALMFFDFGPDGYMAYASNSVRDDMIKGLKELLEVLESQKRAN